MLPTKTLSCGRSGVKARRFVAAPHHDVRRFLDFLDLVAIDRSSCSRRNRPPAMPFGAQLLADREQHGVAEAAADQQRRFPPAAFRSACRSVPSERPARPVSAARTDRTSRPFRARWSTAIPARGSTDGAGEREAFHSPARCRRRRCARAFRNSAAGRTGPGAKRARRHRRAHHDLDDVGRQPDDVVHHGAQFVVQLRAISQAGGTADGCCARASG